MWICLNNSFVSIVENETNPELVWVRSRKYDHLVNFIGTKDGITETPTRDYRYRVSIDKFTLSKIFAQSVHNINYGNFKSSVPDTDNDLYFFYNEVWNSGIHHLDPNWSKRHY